MKTTVYECEICHVLFRAEGDYNTHISEHLALDDLSDDFPIVHQEQCEFSNGHFSVPRSREWLERYRDAVIAIVPENRYPPFTNGWYRSLGDGGSMFYGAALRTTRICQTCYREWGQPYYANHCDHRGTYDKVVHCKQAK